MIILAIDTATALASVAVRKDGATLAEEFLTAADGQSSVIFKLIESALASTGILLAQIDCFASAAGPGSFTGVRICLTAAKGLADGMGKPAIAVSNLRALASFGTAPFRNPILDARRGHIYTAVYDSALTLVSPEILTSADEWKPEAGIESITVSPPLAAAIALCAELDGASMWRDPALLDADYIRQSDAELFWHDHGGLK